MMAHVHMTSSGCVLGGNKSLIADLIDSQVEISEPVLKASALTDEDWLNLAVQYLKSGAKNLLGRFLQVHFITRYI